MQPPQTFISGNFYACPQLLGKSTCVEFDVGFQRTKERQKRKKTFFSSQFQGMLPFYYNIACLVRGWGGAEEIVF
jgi:hypothetical protein